MTHEVIRSTACSRQLSTGSTNIRNSGFSKRDMTSCTSSATGYDVRGNGTMGIVEQQLIGRTSSQPTSQFVRLYCTALNYDVWQASVWTCPPVQRQALSLQAHLQHIAGNILRELPRKFLQGALACGAVVIAKAIDVSVQCLQQPLQHVLLRRL